MDQIPPKKWTGISGGLAPRRFTCGYCGALATSTDGWFNHASPHTEVLHYIYVCSCGGPNFFEPKGQHPQPMLGENVRHVPPAVAALYDEIRRSTAAGAPTAASSAARTLIASVAASKGATPGKSFQFYVEWLRDEGHITPPMIAWVDHLRTEANEAVHELKLLTADDGKRAIQFCEMLLRLVYQMPGDISKQP